MKQHWMDVRVSRIAVEAHRRGQIRKADRATRLLRRIRKRYPLEVKHG